MACYSYDLVMIFMIMISGIVAFRALYIWRLRFEFGYKFIFSLYGCMFS